VAKKCKIKVWVEVRGGTVVGVHSDAKSVEPVIVDHDDFSAGMTMEKEMEYRAARKQIKRFRN
jgi:hypothetical protein